LCITIIFIKITFAFIIILPLYFFLIDKQLSLLLNKKIILVDDSLVRGTTSHKIVKMLYDAGAKEVHVRIASPEIKFPDFYGVDTPTKKELIINIQNI